MACVPPGKAEIKLFVDFEKGQINKLGIKVEGKELTHKIVNQAKPDAVIVANGARPIVPPCRVWKNEMWLLPGRCSGEKRFPRARWSSWVVGKLVLRRRST